MRKFNLKENAAKRMLGMQKAGQSEKSAYPDVPAEKTTDSGMTDGIRIVWRTDVGKIRQNNQDAVIIGSGLAGVADGMGGHNAGEVASCGLRDGLIAETANHEPDENTLTEAIKTVNHVLYCKQENDSSLRGMGTTLTVLWPGKENMIVAQVGDSRAYLIRGGEMKQITEDHSMVADMVRRGVLTEEQAATHPMRNYITRAVGTDEDVDVDIFREKRAAGDRWLVCSDGLYGMMSRTVLEELSALEDPDKAADLLMQTALDNGGRDNISMVLLMDDTGAAEDAEESCEEKNAQEVTENE